MSSVQLGEVTGEEKQDHKRTREREGARRRSKIRRTEAELDESRF